MSEVLRLEYDASIPALVVTLDVVETVTGHDGRPFTRVVLGRTQPKVRITMEELGRTEPSLAVDLGRCIALLEPIARAKSVADIADPDAVIRQAALNAASFDAAEKARAEHASLMAQIEAKQADLAAMAATQEKGTDG